MAAQFFLFLIFWGATLQLNAQSKAEVLLDEYNNLKKRTENLAPDGQIGGVFNYRDRGDHELIWDMNDYSVDQHDTLRIFVLGDKKAQSFSVTYHYSDFLVPQRTVLRRFIGPESQGWRADTIDVTDLEDLGYQGLEKPRLTPAQIQLLGRYKIQLF